MAVASLFIGAIGALIFFYPLPGMVLTLIGMALGITAKKSGRGNMRFAIAGIVINAFFVCAFFIAEIVSMALFMAES